MNYFSYSHTPMLFVFKLKWIVWFNKNSFNKKLNIFLFSVYVGYEYESCTKIIWEVQTTQVSGHDMSVSDIGGWNLDIHHKYNFHEGKYLKLHIF